MSRLLDAFALTHPSDATHIGGEVFVAAERVSELLDQAEREGVQVLGLEGFVVDGATVWPSLSRIADFSFDTPETSTQRARDLLTGSWATAPTVNDQLHPEAVGRHMIVVVLDD